jgi:hypothetical protein
MAQAFGQMQVVDNTATTFQIGIVGVGAGMGDTGANATWSSPSDGINCIQKLYEVGAGTEKQLGVNLRISNAAGSIEAKGQQASASSIPITIASDQVGAAGTAAAAVVSVQGIASMTPVITTGSGTAGSAAAGVVTVQGVASMTPVQITGTLTHNNAAPAATEIGAIVALANATTPSFTEGDQVLLSTTLGGSLRSFVTNSNAQSVPVGGVCTSTEQAAGSSGATVASMHTLTGRQVGQPYSTPQNVVNGNGSASTTGSTLFSIAAQGALQQWFMAGYQFSNSGATAVTIAISDGTTTLTAIVPPGGGNNVTFPLPIQFVANHAVTFVMTGSSTTVYGSAQGYKTTGN